MELIKRKKEFNAAVYIDTFMNSLGHIYQNLLTFLSIPESGKETLPVVKSKTEHFLKLYQKNRKKIENALRVYSDLKNEEEYKVIKEIWEHLPNLISDLEKLESKIEKNEFDKKFKKTGNRIIKKIENIRRLSGEWETLMYKYTSWEEIKIMDKMA